MGEVSLPLPPLPTSWGWSKLRPGFPVHCYLPEQAVQTGPAQQERPVFTSDSTVVSAAA